MAFKLKSLYGVLGDVAENIGGMIGADIIEESENEYKIICDTCFYYIPDLNINIHSAELYIYNTDIKDYEITDSLYLFFDKGKNRMVYSEQGSCINVCVCNYCNLVLKNNITMREVNELDCVYELDEGEVLNKYSSYSIT